MDVATLYGHFEVVKWLYENRSEGCSTLAIDWASIFGHLEIVKWLEESCFEELLRQNKSSIEID